MTLRQYQESALTKIVSRYNAGVYNQLLKMATGLGKTVIFSSLLNFTGWNGKVLVIVHREELVNQAVNKIRELNPGRICSVEMAEQTPLMEFSDFIVASVQSITRSNRLFKYNPKEFCAVVIDEAHHSTAPSYVKVLEYFRNGNLSSLRLGVTATPNRADGKGLGELYDEVVDDYDILHGIKDGWLVDLVGQQIKTTTNLDGVKSSYGDLNISQLSEATNTVKRNSELVDGWKKFGDNRTTILYAVDVASAVAIAKKFHDEGVPADYVYGKDPNRQEKLQRHRDREFKVLTNCEVLTEGHDDWGIGCIALARPTKSESLYIQMVGRGTRIDPEVGNMLTPKVPPRKLDCKVLDYTDNCTQHRLVTLTDLVGIPEGIDVNGKKITEALEKIKKVQEEHPTINIDEFEGDLEKLETYADTVDLFQVKFSPEVEELSKFKWYKIHNGYVLLLANKESIKIEHDTLLDKYHVTGIIKGQSINEYSLTLNHAFMLADGYVKQAGVVNLVKRKAKWHNDMPTEAQLKACKWLKINVPPGATKGEVHSKISQVMAERNNKL